MMNRSFHKLSNGYIVSPIKCSEAYNNIETVDDLKLVAYICKGKSSQDLKILDLIDQAGSYALKILNSQDPWEHDRLYDELSKTSEELGELFSFGERHQGLSKRHDLIQKHYDKHSFTVLRAKRKAKESRSSLIDFHTHLYKQIKEREKLKGQSSFAVIINWLREIGVSSSHDPDDPMAEMKLYDRLGHALYKSKQWRDV